MANSESGLESTEVKRRQEQYGFNELPFADSNTLLSTFVRIITEPMFALLVIAALIYYLIGSLEDTVLLGCFIGISIGITIYQERKSERAISSLKDLSSPQALVKRDGELKRIPSREVVVGDLLILEEGDRVTADADLINCSDFLLDESLLTGESEPVTKEGGQSIYAGSLVVRGRGAGIVQAIGLQTELGKIGKSLKQIAMIQSPLQADIRRLISRFALFGLIVSVIVCLTYGFVYSNWLEGMLAGISLTMALLPEEFTVILTVFMALGAWRISQHHVLARTAPVIETLGSITSLCVDKTGTLTINKMSLQALVTEDMSEDVVAIDGSLTAAQQELLSYAVLASEPEPYDPMEKAFHISMRELYPEHIARYRDATLVHEYGLSPQLPAITHVWRLGAVSEEYCVAIKGSPEAVMSLCKLNDEQRSHIEKQIQYMASNGLRLLGVAQARYRKGTSNWPELVTAFDFHWLGLTGLRDPLRKEVPTSVKECQRAGIRVIMITGDHAVTAQAIAAQAGIDSSRHLSGSQLEQLSDEQLRTVVRDVCLFVRIKPEQKLRLVHALQENGEIVAMTGDGVNDAPALKAAHVGISMGLRGTDVAREASSLVLLDDDFSSIVNAIRQGRQIYDNLQKAIAYVVAVHIPIAGAAFAPVVLGFPPMLGPIHILFLEMIIDPSCAIVFEAEAPEENVMDRPPRDSNKNILSFNNLLLPVLQGLGLLAVVVGLYIGLSSLGHEQRYAATVAFGVLMLGNLLLVVVSRSSGKTFTQIIRIPNNAQYWIGGIAITLFVVFVSSPFLRERFKFSELSMDSLYVVALSGMICLLWLELMKALARYRDRAA